MCKNEVVLWVCERENTKNENRKQIDKNLETTTKTKKANWSGIKHNLSSKNKDMGKKVKWESFSMHCYLLLIVVNISLNN